MVTPAPSPPWPALGRLVTRTVTGLLLSDVRREGPPLPRSGPLLVALRHLHELDGFAVPRALDERPLVGVVDGRVAGVRAAELPGVPWLCPRIGVVPVDRDDARDRRRALRELRSWLEAGAAVCLAPEGDVVHERRRGEETLRSYYRRLGPGRAVLEWVRPPLHHRTPRNRAWTGPLQGGVRALARWTDAPIVPVGVAYLRRRGGGRPRAVVRTGSPLPPEVERERLRDRLMTLSRHAARAP